MSMEDRSQRVAAAWLASLAMLVQACLPLLVAAEIHFASQGALPTVLCEAPIAHQTQHPAGGLHHHPTADHGCPICQAVAAGLGFTLAAAPVAPLPAFVTLVVSASESPKSFADLFTASYRARAPPQPI